MCESGCAGRSVKVGVQEVCQSGCVGRCVRVGVQVGV